jgi:transforming growth factor-beta-induced protein
MKKFILGLAIFAGSTLLTLNSCKKTETVTATALSTIKSDPSLTVFSAIETRSGDDAYVNGVAAIVAPVDTAFNNAGITAAVVATMSPATCDSIVKYYTIASGVNCGGVANSQVAQTTGLGSSMYADSTATALYFNGIPAQTVAPVVVGSTSVYKITQYMALPYGTALQVTLADPSLTLINEALLRTNLIAGLTSGSYTLFLPTNSAFLAAGYPDIPSIDNANINTLTQILNYHVVANRFFANDLVNQTSLTTLQGESIQLGISGGMFQLIGNTDPTMPANLLNNGILAGNVLTYKINNVLLP